MKEDPHIIRLLKNVKSEFDKQKARRHITDDERRQIVERMVSSTLDLAPKNWRKLINEETNLRADWRREKIHFLEDFIGVQATRASRMSPSQGFVMQRKLQLEREKSRAGRGGGGGVVTFFTPPPQLFLQPGSIREK